MQALQMRNETHNLNEKIKAKAKKTYSKHLSVRVVLARKWWFNLLPCDLI
jgi:cell division protein FtsL